MKKWIALMCLLALCLTLCACRPKYTKITVYLDEDLPEAEQRAFGTQLARIKGVEEFTYISPEQALEGFIDNYEDPIAFSGIEPDVFRGRYEVTLTRKSAISKIEKIPGVDEVKSLEDVVDSITAALLSRAVAFFHPCAIIESYNIRQIVRYCLCASRITAPLVLR